MIKTRKGTFAIAPEGEQLIVTTEVKLVPSGRPQQVDFVHKHANGAIIKESFKFSNEVAMDILGKRCDIATGGKLPEGSDIDERDVPDMFLGKTFKVEIVHKPVGDKTFANIRYFKSLVDDGDVAGDDDDL